jgi:hypothetical protein
LEAAHLDHRLGELRQFHIERVPTRKNEFLAGPVAVLALSHDALLASLLKGCELRLSCALDFFNSPFNIIDILVRKAHHDQTITIGGVRTSYAARCLAGGK